jgi:3-oxoacyl-[acyl-carrier protein] reductase
MIKDVKEQMGRIDILVNSAAIRPHKPFTQLKVEEWHSVRGVILDGAFYCTHAVVPEMLRVGSGQIIFITGFAAHVGYKERAHISAAKLGLVGLARGLATDLAPFNIRVNVISPGEIDTVRDLSSYGGKLPDCTAPMGRRGKIEEIAGTCAFLASEDAGYITGQTLHVNGGVAYF